MTGIYKIENVVNGKVYIGQSVDIKRRWIQHRDCRGKDLFHNALRKHPEQFKFSVLLTCPREMLDTWERDMIALYDCIYPKGYNFTNGGGSNTEISDETRRKLSESHKGKPSPMKGLKSNKPAWNRGLQMKPISDETRRKLSESHKGRTAWNKGKSSLMKGKHLSEEVRQRISESCKGKSSPMKGKHLSEETKRRISEAHKGRTAWNKGLKMKDLNELKIHSNNEKQNKQI